MMKKSHSDSSEEREGVSTFSSPLFQETFRETFSSMLRHPAFYLVINDFRTAYEYRRKFPWLAESKDLPDEIGQNGLAYALQSALSTYIAPAATNFSEDSVEQVNECIKQLDREWAEQLLYAADAVIQESFGLKRFEKYLLRVNENAAPISPKVLRTHIAAALGRYYKRQQIGLSPDPF